MQHFMLQPDLKSVSHSLIKAISLVEHRTKALCAAEVKINRYKTQTWELLFC